MIEIPDDDLKKLQELNDLKADIESQIDSISENADEETLEKINYYVSKLHKEASGKSIDENLQDLSFFQKLLVNFQRDVDIDPGRLLGLTDGVFSIVMTLLVFGMALPNVEILTAGDFVASLNALAPTFGITIVSFILTSCFWIYHHEFIKLSNFNMPYLWMNIFYLACISFIPFSTSVIGNYSQFFLSEVIFGINITLVIFFFLLMYKYANDRNFLENSPSKEEKKYTYMTFLIIMAIMLIVNFLGFSVSNDFIYLFLLVPIISTMRDLMFKWNQK